MPVEQTLALIKPDAVAAGHYGKILDTIAHSPLTLKAITYKHLSMKEAQSFYHVHAGRFFFPRLTEFVSSGPLFALILEGENAIDTWRKMMGSTNPSEAASGTLRAKYGTTMNKNAVHGSDSIESAQKEIPYFFSVLEYQ